MRLERIAIEIKNGIDFFAIIDNGVELGTVGIQHYEDEIVISYSSYELPRDKLKPMLKDFFKCYGEPTERKGMFCDFLEYKRKTA